MSRTRRADGRFAAEPGADGAQDAHPLGHDRRDGWVSAFNGIGDKSRDKREHANYQGKRLSYLQLAEYWEKNFIVAKAIEAPGAEAFREGFEIEISSEGEYGDLKESVEDALEDLETEQALELAYAYKRAYGGSAILLGVDDGRSLDQPLRTDRNYPLKYLDVYEPIEILPASLYGDPSKPKFGQAEYYRLNAFNQMGFAQPVMPTTTRKRARKGTYSGEALIHESRLLVFNGIQVSRYLRATSPVSPFWGAPVVPRFIEEVRDFQVSSQGLGILATDASQTVIKIKDLMGMVGKNEQKFRDRMAALELGRSIARAIILDADKEEFQRLTTQLAGIPELWDRLSQYCSAAIGIPLSVLIGYSPASLGKPDDSEMKIWFNFVRKVRRRELTPPLKKIAKFVMRSLRQRKLPKHWGIGWPELERMTTPQLVEARRVQAQTDSLNIKSGMATPDELRRARWYGKYSFETRVPESKKAPGFFAPLPAGVIPGSTPASGVVQGLEAGVAKAGKAGPGAHSVSSYARRNPTAPALGASPSAGGDAPPSDGRDLRKDEVATLAQLALAAAATHPGTAAFEARYQRERADKIRVREPGNAAVLEELARIATDEAKRCSDGTCGPDCLYDHPWRMDDDGTGEIRSFAGMQICVENPKGSTREWIDTDGTCGSTTMKYDYGYVVGSVGTDGDSVDAYLGPDDGARWVYVVHQMSKASNFTQFDEDKVMLGFASPDAARDAYIAQYDDTRFFGGMTMMTVEDFRQKLILDRGGKVTAALDELGKPDHE